jgi:hypothetical protein
VGIGPEGQVRLGVSRQLHRVLDVRPRLDHLGRVAAPQPVEAMTIGGDPGGFQIGFDHQARIPIVGKVGTCAGLVASHVRSSGNRLVSNGWRAGLPFVVN